MRVAEILAKAGHHIEFLEEDIIGTADILLDGTEFEIKSPKTNNTNTIEHRLKEAIRNQSRNIIIDSSRIKRMQNRTFQKWLIKRCQSQPQIKRMLFIDKHGRIVDIKAQI